uniref:NADH dehydrogenase subunit 3 n=1 Tax=Esanthelphusa keyini (nom. nud.) TaxID=2907795 RepID=UPI001EDD4B38|nr:NADH dehydrogenase subunit 3 [Esanthelphusa keyini (nom. nud.)]UIB42747.1 NADH dehydrogenase subunit 3 [Esanthelphusa keyini (nom. nud.)]
MLFISILTFIITLVILLLASLIAKTTMFDREKMSPYECGFDPKGSARLPFSLRFFVIALIFLIFDVEIALLLPISMIMNLTHIFSWLTTTSFFLFILLLGLYYEWYKSALDWSE